jgi:hypothetical protein
MLRAAGRRQLFARLVAGISASGLACSETSGQRSQAVEHARDRNQWAVKVVMPQCSGKLAAGLEGVNPTF